jgi:hypothetical protein
MIKIPQPPHCVTGINGFGREERFTKFCGDEDCHWCNAKRTVKEIKWRFFGLFYKLIWREPSQNNPLQNATELS